MQIRKFYKIKFYLEITNLKCIIHCRDLVESTKVRITQNWEFKEETLTEKKTNIRMKGTDKLKAQTET